MSTRDLPLRPDPRALARAKAACAAAKLALADASTAEREVAAARAWLAQDALGQLLYLDAVAIAASTAHWWNYSAALDR